MDINKYIGIPFDEFNCWQLVMLVLREEYNILVSHMTDMTAEDMDAVSFAMADARTLNGWRQVEIPMEGDISMMLINSGGKLRPEHVGIVIAGNNILHSMGQTGINSAAHSIKLLSRKFAGLEYYRHATR